MSEAQRVAIASADLHACAAALAYESATYTVESKCKYMGESEASGSVAEWFELPNPAAVDETHLVAEALKYLDARGLILRHPHMANWIAMSDESEAAR